MDYCIRRIDQTDDTLTTTAGSGAGTILIKHTNSTGSETIATAGSAGGSAFDATAGYTELQNWELLARS